MAAGRAYRNVSKNLSKNVEQTAADGRACVDRVEIDICTRHKNEPKTYFASGGSDVSKVSERIEHGGGAQV